MKKPSRKVLQRIVVAGCFLIKIPFGLGWYVGNLAPYMYSYFLYHKGDNAFDIQPEWILTTIICSNSLGMVLVDYATRIFSLKSIQLASILICDISIFLTYFSVQQSVSLVLVSFALINGIGLGAASIVALKYVAIVAPERVGTYTAFTMSAICVGGALSTLIITGFINPHNLSPDIQKWGMIYFSQIQPIEKVPSVFILLGILFSVIHAVGYALQQLPIMFFYHILVPESNGVSNSAHVKTNVLSSEDFTIELDTSREGNQVNFSKINETETCCEQLSVNQGNGLSKHTSTTAVNHGTANSSNETSKICPDMLKPAYGIRTTHNDGNTGRLMGETYNADIEHSVSSGLRPKQIPFYEQTTSTTGSSNVDISPRTNDTGTMATETMATETTNSNTDKDERNTDLNLKPFQLFRTRQFFILWLSIGFFSFRQIFLFYFYKIYAQLWIKDDMFLTTVGSVSIITAAVCRMIIGLFVDVYGVRNVFVSVFTIESVFIFFWSVSAQVDKWFYLLVYQVIVGVESTVFILVPLATLKMFGPLSYASNLGIVFTGTFVASIASPPIYPIVLDSIGWFAMSILGGVLAAVSAWLMFLNLTPKKKVK